ncbi:MAG: DUF87 domain-containing protein [Bacilli bacterium]|jgi:hypothetical protein|nr:DUF87 domain-containing protein [Bacilli bacterium]
MRIIPKNSKVKVTFYKGITIADMVIGLIALALIALTLSSNFSFRFYLATGILCLGVVLYLPLGDNRLYVQIWHLFRFLFSKKRFKDDSSTLVPYKEVKDSIIYEKDGSVLGVIEISPINFKILDETRQDDLIDGCFARILNSVSDSEEWSLMKLELPLVLDQRMKDEMSRVDTLNAMKNDKKLSDHEFMARADLVQFRMVSIDEMNSSETMIPHYYLVLNGYSVNSINEKLDRTIETFVASGIKANRLDEQSLYTFIKAGYGEKFDPRSEMKIVSDPTSLKFGLLSLHQETKNASELVINRFPLSVPNGWAERLYSLPNTKVVMRMKPIEKSKAIKRIDNAILEIGTKNVSKESQLQESDTHLDTLRELLEDIQQSNETLFDTTVIVTVYDEEKKATNKKLVKDALREMGFGFSELLGRQMDGYITSMPSTKDLVKMPYGIQSSTLAASFPFSDDLLADDKGLLIGENSEPVFLNVFKRDLTHVNSNMIIIGQSGSGKSYATKSLLSGLATEGDRIYVLDPESEYGTLAKNLGGSVIDASNGEKGRINPFQIMTTMDDEGGSSNSYYAHLQFLEQFYKVVLQGINQDSLELLNKLTEEVYASKDIRPGRNLSLIKSEEFPVFEDLCLLADKKLKEASDAYEQNCLRVLVNYLYRFKSGGRDSSLWNGYTTFSPTEAFITFDFQRLLANKNDATANAQMLLLLRWLENEVIRNKDSNTRNGTNRKIVVAIDEAHLFIDEKYPIALDFMYSLAKRIRKYDGMLIIITQNVRDFAGTPEIARKSTAIINVSQYSMIFSLSPNDMNELMKLYENSGGINEFEKDSIIHNPRGTCFLISSPKERGNVAIVTDECTSELFDRGTWAM